MCVFHGHGNAAVTEDALQGEDVAAVHHEVTGEGVTQDVGELTLRQIQTKGIDAPAEVLICALE